MTLKEYFRTTQAYHALERAKFQRKIKSHVCDIVFKDPVRIVDINGTYEIMGDLPPVIYHISETSLFKNYENLGDKVSKKFVSDLYYTVNEVRNLTNILTYKNNQK